MLATLHIIFSNLPRYSFTYVVKRKKRGVKKYASVCPHNLLNSPQDVNVETFSPRLGKDICTRFAIELIQISSCYSLSLSIPGYYLETLHWTNI